jgi:hypothetical protein
MTRRASFRFLGDQQALVVHDLDQEDEERCQVQPLLRSGRGITFRPDRLEEARRRDFDPCPYCLGEPEPASADEAQLPSVLRSKTFLDHAHPDTP